MFESDRVDKGSPLLGTLVASIGKVDPDQDLDGAAFHELPTFVAAVVGEAGHILVTSLGQIDISPFVFFASKWTLSRINIYLVPFVLGGKRESLSRFAEVLKFQSRAFRVALEIFEVDSDRTKMVEPASDLEVFVQDRKAGSGFMQLQGADDMVELFSSKGCQVLFVSDTLIATYLGLEVGRCGLSEGSLKLEIGVGRTDRMAKSMLLGSQEPTELLDATIKVVEKFRLGHSEFHPLARLSLPRWMRMTLVQKPEIVGAIEVIPIELDRGADWPSQGIWSSGGRVRGASEDDLMFESYNSSFIDDDISFALAIYSDGTERVLGIFSGIVLGAVAKLYEVTQSCIGHGRNISGSIMVSQDKSRIIAIERLVQLAAFEIATAALTSEWKISNPS